MRSIKELIIYFLEVNLGKCLKYIERYEDVIFYLETALNTTVANNAHQKKTGHRFVADNSGEVTPFDWHNAQNQYEL